MMSAERMANARVMIKDPLQVERTPYEVLDVSHDPSEEEIEEAFQNGFVNGIDHQDLLNSKRVLQDPVERALVDAFLYSGEVAGNLKPSIASNPSALGGSHRWETAQSWQEQFKTGFPDAAMAHTLAVFWYWSAIYADSGQARARFPVDAPTMWRRAAGCWGMALADRGFWQRLGTPVSEQDRIQQEILGKITENLRRMAQQYRTQGDAAANQYQQIEQALRAEFRTAGIMAGVGVRFNRKSISCGLLLLDQMELRQDVLQIVASESKKRPNEDRLRKLQDALSEFATIAELLAANSPQGALDVIEALPRAKSQKTECVELRAKALHALGRQRATAGQVTEALALWKRALEGTPPEVIKRKILEDVVSACQTKASALRANQSQAAIDLLEVGIGVSDDGRLKLLLGDILLKRGIDTVSAALDDVGGRPVAQTRLAMQSGVADVERATGLGTPRAAEELEMVRGMLNDLEIEGPMREAKAAVERDDWDTAVTTLRRALVESPEATPVKKFLAHCLTQRAVIRVNKAIEQSQAKGNRDKSELMQKLALASSGSCAQCGKYMGHLAEMKLCPECLPEVMEILSGRGGNKVVLSAITASERELLEAARLDSQSTAVQKNQNDLRELRQQVEQGAAFAPPPPADPFNARTRSPAHRPSAHADYSEPGFWRRFGKANASLLINPYFNLLVVGFGYETINSSATARHWISAFIALVYTLGIVWYLRKGD